MLKIVEAHITKQPVQLFDPLPEVVVTYNDGVVENLFSYYPDEISFVAEEFIGLTRQQALELKGKKDVAYLREGL